MRIYSNSWIPAFAGMTEGRLALRFTLFKSGNQLTNLKRDTHLLSFFHLLPAPKRCTLHANLFTYQSVRSTLIFPVK